MCSAPSLSGRTFVNRTVKPNPCYFEKIRITRIFLVIVLVTTLSAHAQLRIPDFTEVGGTQLTNTQGQWVRIDPAQPNNIDLVESRLFKMPRKGDGVEAIEFKLVGGDGGTAWYKNSEHNHFANGGRGGDLNFTLDFRSYTNDTYYGKPFIATFGKKGESVTFGQSFYVAAGGGGSTALAWLMPDMVLQNVYRTRTTLSGYYEQGGGYFISGGLIASAGGGSGGFATVLRGVHGASAWFSDQSFPPQNHDQIDAFLGLNFWKDNVLLFTQMAGGSVTRNDAFDGLNPPDCCTVDLMARNATGIVHNEYNVLYENGFLQGIQLGQEGGKPTVIWRSNQSSGSTTYERGGFGSTFKIIGGGNTQVSVVKNGGRGGAGWTGGGAGISTTDFFGSLNSDNEALLPTSGAGGTGSFAQGSYPRDNRRPGMPGWNVFSRLLENTGTNQHNSTNTPQSGYVMYRTISETTPPEIRMTAMTVNLGNAAITPNGYNPVVSFSTAIAPYLMKDDGIWDNDGIASVTATVNGQPFTQFECYMARPGAGPIPVYVTATDGAGNSVDGLIMVTVRDPFVPVPQMELGPPGDLERPYRIDVSNGPVTLTDANFPVPFDGCKSSANVELHFTSTTFYCNDAGHRPVQYYYTDSDGNSSPVYTKTFVVQCNGSTPGNQRYVYVDEAATGANDGTSWGNAFKSLKDALNVPQVSAIYVAQGTYKPTTESDRDARFEPGENAKLYGGFPTGGADFSARNPEAYPTILSGEIGDAGILNDNSRHIMVITRNNVHLEGFTIRDGYSSEGERGVGIWIGATETTLPTDFKTVVRNCKFLNNNAGTSNGGAIYTHYRNTTHTNYLYVQNCLFDGNTANNGGAVFLENYTALPNTIQEFTNCVFNNNTASQSGGGLSVQQSTEVKLVNCTFGANTAVNGGAIYNNGTVRLHNGIVYSNSGSIANSGTFQADYSNIQGSGGSSSWSLSGIQDLGHNIDADPQFAASPALSIRKGSPSANTGLNSYNTEPYDIRGNRRIHMSTIDMGAYETENFAVFVAADAPAGGDGTSWATAFNNLHDGIAAAGTGPDTKDVWIKAGTYRPSRRPGYATTTPGSRDNSFYVNAPIKIYGGFAGTESSTMERNIGQNPTILNGDINTPDDASDNTYHVLTLHTDEARLDGLIIEGGNANDGQDANKRIGGGVFQYEGGRNHMITNSVFRNNHATDRGGALFLNANSQGSSDFVQCVFYGNTASRGAAVNMYNASGSDDYTLNFYQITAYNNTSSAAGAGAFEASQASGSSPARLNFYNSLLAGNMPQNYNDTGNPGHIFLTHTFASASADGVFANTSNIAGADGKIMTADDGLLPSISSPAIGYGNETHLHSSIDRDITDSQRIIHKVDAGAYESPYNAPLAADANHIIYVRPVAMGEGTGQDWDNATADLHNAIHSYNVQKVFVAVGTYKVGAHSFIMKNGVEIYGGFDPGNGITDLSHKRIMPDPTNNSPQSTVLDGQQIRPVIWNVFNAATAMDNTAVLDGFMIVNGKYTNGGGVRNVYASPVFRNVVIYSNRATLTGGGMYNQNSSPELTNVIINHNGIDAILNPNGGQVVMGGGMYNTEYSNPVLTNVTLAENFLRNPDAAMLGAGMRNNNSSPVIKNSILWNNRKDYNITIGGADIENAGTVNLTLKNTTTQGYDTGNAADGNKININPDFVNSPARNFRLSANSPAIDAGNNQFYPGLGANSKDVANNPRVFDFAGSRNIDMGAYEYQCIPMSYSDVTFENQTITYDGNPHSLSVQNLIQDVAVTYEITDSANQATSGNTATNVGIYTVTATIIPMVSGVDCESVVKIATLTINKAESIITAQDIQDFVYDGTAKNITASLNHNGAALTYSPQQGYTDAGVYPITVSVPETNNYLAASKTIILSIENDEFAGISLNDTAFTYDGTPKSLTVRGTLPAGTTVQYTGNQRTDAGTYTVGASLQKAGYNELWLSATLTIHKAPAEITATPVQKYVYDGTVKNVTAALNHSDTTLTFSPQQGYTAPGTYQVFISAAETANYLAVTDTVQLIIEKAKLSGITFRDSVFTYDGTAKSLAVSGLPADATVVYEGNGKINAGTYSVKATVSRINYQDSTLTATLKINKAPAVITTAPIQKYVYDGTVKNVVATLNHTETDLSYSPRQGYSATGTYRVIISAATTTNYQAATDTVDLVIEKANLSGIILRDSVFTYDGKPKSLAVSGLPAGATVTYSGNAKTNAGTYTVTATVKRENYQDSLLSATLTIHKAAAVITAVQTQKHVYNGTVKNVAASLNHSETTMSYTPKQGYSAAGTYPIIISAAETGNYLAASDTVSLVIENAAFAGITFRDSTFTYDGTAKSLTVSGLPANATAVYEGNGKINAGTYTVKATVSRTNYRDSLLTATLKINKAAAVITAAPTQKHIYDGAVKNVVATLNHTEADLAYSPKQGYSATGTYPIIISAAATANYLAASDTVDLVIEKANLSGIILRDSVFTYDGKPKSLAISGLPAGATVAYSGNAKTNAGIYTVTATVKRENYQDSLLSATLTIHKAAATITAAPIQKHVYDGTVKTVVASLNHTEATLTYSPQQGYTEGGTYSVIISAAETGNYLKTADTVSLVIEKTGITGITFRDSSFTYDGTAKSLTVTGLPADATVVYEGNGKINAGTYTVKATVSHTNYRDSLLTATLIINKAAALITAAPTQKHMYDGTVKNAVATLNHTETTLTYSPQQGYTKAGNYRIIISAAETGNYFKAADTVNLVIENATLAGIAFRDSTFTYDGTAKSLTVSGLPADATVVYEGNGKINAGTYSVKATVKRENYQDSTLTATLKINKAAAVITAAPTQKQTYDGTVKNVVAFLNHTEAALSYSPKQGYSATGTYPVIISAEETANYLAALDTVNLVIEKANMSGITLRDSVFTYDGTPKSLAVSGLPAGATVAYSGNAKTNAGIYTVTATVKREDYQDSLLTATLTIHKAAAVITAAPTQKHVYNGTVKNVAASLNHSETTLTYSPQQGYSAAGTYSIIISAAETGNYLKTADTVNLVIENAGISGLAFRDSTFTYDGSPKSLATSGLPADATVSYTGNARVNAGTYTVTAVVKRPNYRDSTLTATLKINKAAAVIIAAQTQKHVYNGTVKNVTASLNHSETTLTYSPQQGYTKAGNYRVIISAAETGNYLKAADTVSLVIENAGISGIAFRDSTFTYDGTAKSLTVTGLPADATVVYEGNGKINTGTYSVKATVKRENYQDSTLTATLKINKTAAVITAAPTQKHIYDEAVKNVVAFLNHTEAALSYSPKQGYSATGTYRVIISAAATANYLAASDTVDLVIEKANMSGITLRDSVFTYDGTAKSLAVSGLPAGAAATYTGNAKTHAGIYTVTAIVKRTNYQDSTLTATLTIRKAAATITAAPIQKHVYDSTVKNVAASLNHSETTLTYSPQQGYTEAGTHPVIISAAETGNYLKTADTVNLVIEKAGISGLAFRDSTFTYDGTAKSLTVSGLPADATVVYEGNGKINAGTYSVKATVKRENYQDSTLTATLKINKAAAVITSAPTQKHIYDGTVKNVVATLNHTEAALSYSPQQGYSATGTYPVIISAAATANYLAASDTVDLVIEKANLSGIILRDSVFTYDGKPKSLAVSGLPAGATVTYSGNAKTNAGIYTVTATVKRENYQDSLLSATLTIHKAAAVITAAPTQKHVYDGTVKNVAAYLNHTETSLTYSPQRGYAEVGTYPVIISAAETGNYLKTTDTVSLVIENAALAGISFRDSTFTYDGTAKSLTVSGLPADATAVYEGNGKINAGTYTVKATVKRQNYQDSTLTAILKINKAAATITAAPTQKHVYNGTVKNVAASLNHSETTLTYAPQQGYTEAGTYPVIISAAETGNYLKTADTVNLVIETAGLSGIAFRDSTFTYDGKPKSLAVSGLPAGATVTYSGNAKTNAGIYTVTATVKRQNYQDSTLTAILKINKAAALITAAPTQKHVYDGTVKNVAAALNHTEITLTYTPQQGYTAVGTYPVMVSASETANYLAVSDTVSLVIEKAGLAGITFKDSTFTYDGTPKSLGVSGLPEDATVSYTGNAKTNAGTYTVTATVKRQNYQDSTLTATLKINKAAAVITADAIQNRVYNGTMKKVGASLNHKEALLSYSPAEGYTQAGNYEITLSAPESNNYLAASKKVKLVIDKASFQGIVFPNGEFTYNGSAYSVYLWGAPEGSHITYYGNGQTHAGNYTVKALIQKENYHDLELYATLTIHKAQSYISTEAYQAHVYDGSVKNVQAWLNHSETALVYYPQQGYTDAGSYQVNITANESRNYLSTSASVHLFIDKARFQGVTLAGKEFTYNGSPHALAVSGAPEGAQLTYTGNNQVNAGTYKVTALVQMKNYYDLELEANLIIHKAPQTITFAEIPVTHLENDSDFQLHASSSSGLPVTYSYTYQAEEPPATVTEQGWVELHTSGYVSITAHQPGNENYLPAEPVMRQLKINSSDATLHRITINGEVFETPDTEIYYLIDCSDDTADIPVQLKTEVGAYVVPGRSLTIEIPRAGIYKQEVVITSQDSTNVLTYHITIEKRFKFENIGVQKFNNLFLVNNNPQTNGGYEFTEYEWLKNGEVIGTGQYYSAGNQSSDILDQGAVYTVRMKTKDGQWLSSCGFGFLPDASFTIGIFPNPVRVGDVLKVKVSDPAEARVSILTLTGQPVLETFMKAGSGEIKLPSRIPAGSYILHYENEKYRRSLSFILEK